MFFPSILTTDRNDGVVTMSDILFMSVKEHAGKMRETHGTATATGDLCTITANTGKDMYLAKAKINGESNGTSVSEAVQVALKVNGTTVETFDATLAGGSASEGEFSFEYEFASLGEKVATGQIIKLEVIAISSTALVVNGKIEVFEETTGDSPFQASEFS